MTETDKAKGRKKRDVSDKLKHLFPESPLFGMVIDVHEYSEVHQFEKLTFHGQLNQKEEMHELGMLRYDEPGHYIQGWLEKGTLNGLAKLVHPSGVVYEGMFERNLGEGYGLYRFADGTQHWGLFKADKMTGLGRRKYPDTTDFYGNFVKNKKSGIGFCVLGYTRHQMLAEFKKDKADGYGFYSFGDGGYYEGRFKAGHFHGHGKLVVGNSGDIYCGNFTKGVMSGDGQWMFGNGGIYVGKFRSNSMHGSGVYYDEGRRYEVLCDHGAMVTKDPTQLATTCDVPPKFERPIRPDSFVNVNPKDLPGSMMVILEETGGVEELRKAISKAKKRSKLLVKKEKVSESVSRPKKRIMFAE